MNTIFQRLLCLFTGHRPMEIPGFFLLVVSVPAKRAAADGLAHFDYSKPPLLQFRMEACSRCGEPCRAPWPEELK